MQKTFNNRVTQLVILALIILLAILLLKELWIFMPGLLGAITLYILLREIYFRQTQLKKRNKTWMAILFIMVSIIVIAVPLFLVVEMVTKKLMVIINNSGDLLADAKMVGIKIKDLTGFDILSDDSLSKLQQGLTQFVPKVLNSSFNILSNFAIMFFLLYFMLKSGRQMELFLSRFIPFKRENVQILSSQTKSMVKANAVGIPVLAIIQGIVASIGYWIFGVHDVVLWGIVTGVCSLIPIVGTAIVWIPLSLYLLSINHTGAAIGLAIYAGVLITNIDYVARLTLLKKLMDIHPIITVLGVIIGLGLFGFWGVIFGPLLLTYFLILVKIYINEYGTRHLDLTD